MRHVLFVVVVISILSISGLAQSANTQTPTDQEHGTPPYSVPTTAQKQQVTENLRDVHFAFDRYDLTSEDRGDLEAAANWLKANPNVYVTIAGDADERGSIVYNLYLSDKRAKAAKDALIELGVAPQQIVFATGWGKLYPLCNQSDESCWSQNRRAHFEPWQAQSLAASKSVGAQPLGNPVIASAHEHTPASQ